MILHGPENIVGFAQTMARAQRVAGLDAVAICHPSRNDQQGDLILGSAGNSLWNVLARIIGEVDILHLYFGRSFTGDDLSDAYLAKSLKKPVFMTLLGCDVRDSKRVFSRGEPTMCTTCWPQSCSINRRATLDLLSTLKTPALTTTPDLALEVSNSVWLPLPIDLAVWHDDGAVLPRVKSTFRVLHAPTDRGKKGTQFIIAAVNLLREKGCPIELVLAEGVSQVELRALAQTCDMAIDQVMAGVYGTFAAEMMAFGLPTIARISDQFRASYPQDLPIISAGPDSLVAVLEQCMDGRVDLALVAENSRAYAANIHCQHKVAARLSALY